MRKVVIVVDAEVEGHGAFITASSPVSRAVSALRQAILQDASAEQETTVQVRVLSTDRLLGQSIGDQDAIAPLSFTSIESQSSTLQDLIWCPLTLNLPDTFRFPGEHIYRICRDVDCLRQYVQQQLDCAIGSGCFWLPIVYTEKGPLYAEVVGLDSNTLTEEPAKHFASLSYLQPIHLPDIWRQPLYHLGYRLLKLLSAPPAVYLMQFGLENHQLYFDRLWPFPAIPAIASLGVQEPDLFTCHWRCLTQQPILDLTIPTTAKYKTHNALTLAER